MDKATGTLYWGEPGVIANPPFGAVNSGPLGVGPSVALLPHDNGGVSAGGGEGRSIALDPAKGLLFFSAFDPASPTTGGEIWKWDFIGAPALIYSDASSGFPDIEVDPLSMRLYFTDYANDKIRSIDYFGGALIDELVLVSGAAPFGLALELVPEPSTWLLLGTGLLGLACYRWRKWKQEDTA